MNGYGLGRRARQRIPLTIVSGSRGAGKTTLLRRLLTHGDGRHTAVVLDHPAALHLDGDDVAHRDGSALTCRDGSTCHGFDGDVALALAELQNVHAARLPDQVVLEAPSTASLKRMAGYAYLPGFRPGGVITVVNAAEVEAAQAENGSEALALASQLAAAELIVVNQVDRVGPAARQAVRRWLRNNTERAQIVECEHCALPTPLLLGASIDHAPVHAVRGEWTPGYGVDTEPRRHQVVQPRHDNDFRAWVLTTREPIDVGALRRWVGGLPDEIVHGDGLLQVRSERRRRFRFHRCGNCWTLSHDDSWDDLDGAPESWITLVGLASARDVGVMHGDPSTTSAPRRRSLRDTAPATASDRDGTARGVA